MTVPAAALTELGLRERKKRRTRETILRVAQDLFDRQGFAATTIPQIAEAADVSPRTVSAYFPVKEELAFPERAEWLDNLRAHLTERPGGATALEALRAWIAEQLPEWKGREAQMRRQRRIIDADEHLRAYERRVFSDVQTLIAEAIARDLGCGPGDVEPLMAAAATTATLDVIGQHYEPRASACAPVDPGELLAQLDRALRFVAGGIEALRSD